jgi:hypothetical protein
LDICFNNRNIPYLCLVWITVNYKTLDREKRWGYQTAYIGMKQYNQRIKEIEEDRNVYFIDLEKYIAKSLVYFYDEVHCIDATFNNYNQIDC